MKNGFVAEHGKSLSSWRAWIEMGRLRLPHIEPKSLSSWRAWIEILIAAICAALVESLSSWRAWIEIIDYRLTFGSNGRSPHGERGLKYLDRQRGYSALRSLSSWRAWIEMHDFTGSQPDRMRRSPHGERGLKYIGKLHGLLIGQGRSPHGERGLKFEQKFNDCTKKSVALLMESVD